ncbi:MAG: DOMON domain-containing protein [Bacteroidota bacterium]
MQFYLAIIFCYGLLVNNSQHFSPTKTIEKNGMQVSWQLRGDYLEVEVFGPTDGWVAIGFNEKSGLKGTNLIMANVVDGKATVADHYIVGVGDPRKIKDLDGGRAHIDQVSGSEGSEGTSVKFRIYRKAKDPYHFDLMQQRQYYMLLAYSQADEFEHHSIMRTETRIEL